MNEVLLRERACIGIVETTQLLSSVPVGERCRDKSADEDVFSIISVTLARFVVNLAMPLASKKIGGFDEDVLRTTVAQEKNTVHHRRHGLLQTFQGVSIVAVCFHHVCQANLVSQSITVQVQRQSGREHYQHEVQL